MNNPKGMKRLHSGYYLQKPVFVFCDLEGRWGNRLAPEVSREPVLDAGWTKKSDIYDSQISTRDRSEEKTILSMRRSR
jgi:hypothetical protein